VTSATSGAILWKSGHGRHRETTDRQPDHGTPRAGGPRPQRQRAFHHGFGRNGATPVGSPSHLPSPHRANPSTPGCRARHDGGREDCRHAFQSSAPGGSPPTDGGRLSGFTARQLAVGEHSLLRQPAPADRSRDAPRPRPDGSAPATPPPSGGSEASTGRAASSRTAAPNRASALRPNATKGHIRTATAPRARRRTGPGRDTTRAPRRGLRAHAGLVEKTRRGLPGDPNGNQGHLTLRLPPLPREWRSFGNRAPVGSAVRRRFCRGRHRETVAGRRSAPPPPGLGSGRNGALQRRTAGVSRHPATPRLGVGPAVSPRPGVRNSRPSRGEAHGSIGRSPGGNAKGPQRTRRRTKALRPSQPGRAQQSRAPSRCGAGVTPPSEQRREGNGRGEPDRQVGHHPGRR
jgi:hypothetical protein